MFDKVLLGLSGMRGALAALALAALAQAALVIGQAMALASAIASLWAGAAVESQLPLLAAFFACFAGRQAIRTVQEELLDGYAQRQTSTLHSRLLEAAFDERAPIARKNGTAATATALNEGIDQVAAYIRLIPPKMCGMIGISLPLLAALFAIDWVSGAIALVALPVIAFFMVMLGRQARERAERQFGAYQRLSNHFIDTLRGIETIDALGAGGRAEREVFETSERLRAATVRTLSVATLSGAVLDLVSVFGTAAIAMMLAFRLMDGTVGLTTALSALMLAPEFFSPIRSFASDFHASLDGKNALADIMGMVNGSVDEHAGQTLPRRDAHRASAPVRAHARSASSSPSRAAFGGGRSVSVPTEIALPETPNPARRAEAPTSLEAEGLSFRHDGATEDAIHDVSLSLSVPGKVGIVGASGSGKSTLVDLLAGFREPTGGAVRLDGEEADLCSQPWKSQIHYMPQDPHVFSATVAENVRLYAPGATRDAVEQAVRAVGLDRLVAELPDGLDTLIGEGGRGLSGGQAQRIALARMLLDDRPVLLFDEPTAHLDIETELELKRRMLPLMEGKLVLFATHRLHWLADMDRIVVLEGGAVAEAGTLDELLASDGALRRFIDAEKGGEAA